MKKILIVDNMEVGRQFTETVLSTMYETFGASNGEEALKIFRESRPDLVLSKVYLSDMSGAELLNKLQVEFGEIIPFVLTGADTDRETKVEALKSGASKVFIADLTKDFIENYILFRRKACRSVTKLLSFAATKTYNASKNIH